MLIMARNPVPWAGVAPGPGSLSAGTIAAAVGDTQAAITQTALPTGGTLSYTYDLYRSTTNGVKGSLVASSIGFPYDDTGLTNSTTYYYTVEVDDGVTTADTPQVSVTPAAASGPPFAVPTVNAFYNSTEFELSGGEPVNSDIVWMDDFSRGWVAKYNVIGYPGPQNAGTRTTEWTVANQAEAIPDTAGIGVNYYATTTIPGGGIPGVGLTGDPDVWLNTQPGRGGATYAASYGDQPVEGGDWFWEHELARNVTELVIRCDFYFYSGYQFGQEKVMTFREGGTFGDGGIQWGGLYWNPGAGSASSTGSVSYSHSTLGGGTNFNSGFSVTAGKWYSIAVGLVLGTGSGDGAIRIWADDLGADGNTIPSGRTPTLRGEWTGLSIPSIGGTTRNIGNVWMEAWSNPGSSGTQARTNIVALEGTTPPLIRDD